MVKRLFVCALLIGKFSLAAAMPMVDGKVISWPDDGWYQVQDELTYVEVCSGGRSCTVSPGTYKVINHSTGERFKGIVVTDSSNPEQGVSVTGNVINWPDDGWYQVQEEATNKEVCSGGRSCTVAPGSYKVINHTTGERFKGIKVGESVEPISPITVSGNTISWPDDGWYQVQDKATYSEICGGGRSCTAVPGTYVVINHSTGMRWSNVKISDSQIQDTTRVDFRITVPAYMSNALQVRLVWGDIDIAATWIGAESWTVFGDFPTNTENRLVVTFYGRNGDITLGRSETDFKTRADDSEIVEISAAQFNTAQWDDDNDGLSNLDELIAGSNPQDDSRLRPGQVSLDLVQDKTFRITWQPTVGALYYRVMENPDGVSGFTDISGELGANTTNYDHRVALYSRVNAEYLVQSCAAQGCVDSAQVVVEGTLNNAIGYVKASNTGRADFFGAAVSLSADGNTMAVTSYAEGSSATGINGVEANDAAFGSGAVYLFVRGGGLWQQQAYIKASNAEREDRFGYSVSLSADGNTLAVGATFEDSAATGINSDQNDNSESNSGAVYVFVRNDEQWLQEAYIKANRTEDGNYFGYAVSLDADGNTLAVGASGEDSTATGINGVNDDDSATNSGAVYVFTRSERQWQQQTYLKASNAGFFDDFGKAVSLSADGITLAVGARGEDSAATGINADQNDNSKDSSGAVYVFVQSDDLWQQQAYIKASNTDSEDSFGSAVSLSADGSTMVVGAYLEDSASSVVNGDQEVNSADNSADDSGAVYVFGRTGGSWQQQAYIKAVNTNGGDWFGFALSLSANGDMLAVGARGESSAATGINGDLWDNSLSVAGAAYVFVRSNGLWQQQTYIKASNTRPTGRFGESVALSADANTLAIGAIGDGSAATGINGDQADYSAPASGAVLLY